MGTPVLKKVGSENEGDREIRGFDFGGDESAGRSVGGRQHMELVYNNGMSQVISLGWLNVYLFSLVILFAFLWMGFVFFKKTTENHVDEEISLDTVLLMGLLGVVMARLFFVIGNWQTFSSSWARILFLKEYSGMSGWGAVLGVFLAAMIVARKVKAELFDWLDMVSLAVASALPIVEAGRLVMKQGGLLWGVIPEMLLRAVLLLGLFWGLWRLEKEYRTFEWYRHKRTQANTGFITGVLLAGYGLFKVIILLLLGANGQWNNLWIGLVLMLTGGGLIYWRSGRGVSESKGLIDGILVKIKKMKRKKKFGRRGINR